MEAKTNPGTPRIYGPFPARVRAVDPYGQRFTIDTELDPLSPTDVYLRLNRQVERFARVLAVVKVFNASVALRGTVSRVEPQEHDSYGLTVTITRHRFLF